MEPGMREPEAHGSEPRVFMWMRVPVMFHIEVNCHHTSTTVTQIRHQLSRRTRTALHRRSRPFRYGAHCRTHCGERPGLRTAPVCTVFQDLDLHSCNHDRSRGRAPARRALDKRRAPCAHSMRHSLFASTSCRPSLQHWPSWLIATHSSVTPYRVVLLSLVAILAWTARPAGNHTRMQSSLAAPHLSHSLPCSFLLPSNLTTSPSPCCEGSIFISEFFAMNGKTMV